MKPKAKVILIGMISMGISLTVACFFKYRCITCANNALLLSVKTSAFRSDPFINAFTRLQLDCLPLLDCT